MDHKKVANFAAYDENLNLIVDGGGSPIGFMAEFNSGFFGGDISAADGTFSGVLTANAIDAVDRLNINGNAVAIDLAYSAPRVPPTNFFAENSNHDVFTGVVNVPDAAGGTLIITLSATFEYNDPGDPSQYFFHCYQKYYLNGALITQAAPRNHDDMRFNRIQKQFMVEVGSGPNTFQFVHFTSSGTTTPYGFFSNVAVNMSYVRK